LCSELLNIYCSGSKIKKNEMDGECSRRGTHRILVGKPKGKGTLGRSRLRSEDNSKTESVRSNMGMAWTGFI
jgi:hypothetical protein